MRRARNSQNTLMKPFKSPARASASTTDPVSTPTRPVRKRPAPGSAPPLSTHLTVTPKRPRTQSIRRLSSCKSVPRSPATARDPEIHALMQEKADVQRQLSAAKEERVVVERALALQTKDDAHTVDALIAKWQIACSAACEELFALLKPAMEAQREAAALGLRLGFDEEQNSKAKPPGSEYQSRHSAVGNEASGASGDNDNSHEEIDIPYMLKQFNIDPDLF
ncbi:hypothetical protein H4R23_001184 [Coemansia sp. Cherry 401B]|nr:hypothetical protein IWW52_001280 [Coemansia sp. RSA 2704]KAJ2738385.1 hypothetical protein H4R23_001184 [Coemansia sp. Cherry 401B]